MSGQSIGFEMKSRNCSLFAFVFGAIAALTTNPLLAQTRVGEAAVVKNEVLRVAGSATSRINVGDGLLRDEIVRTGLDSAARLVMSDSTNLSLGANSMLRLDRTVFDDANSYRDISIKLTTGAFRFVTGNSDKDAYKIQTQVATIGVRGTILDILSQRGRTTVVLRDNGASRVCTLIFQCLELTKPGDTAVVTFAGGKYTIQKSSNPPWTFACNAAAGLCNTTQYADATPTIMPPVDANDMLCGR